MADRLDPRNAFRTAITLFTVASVPCDLAADLTRFTLAWIAKGATGALMVPVGVGSRAETARAAPSELTCALRITTDHSDPATAAPCRNVTQDC